MILLLVASFFNYNYQLKIPCEAFKLTVFLDAFCLHWPEDFFFWKTVQFFLQMFKYVAALFFAAFCLLEVSAETTSPCPELFKYGKVDKGTYEGVLTLNSDARLYGVWVRVFFDKPITVTKLPVSSLSPKNQQQRVNNKRQLVKMTVCLCGTCCLLLSMCFFAVLFFCSEYYYDFRLISTLFDS